MEVLVTGGTGFIGRQVVRQLVEEGHGVRVLGHRPSKGELGQGVVVYQGDILRADSLTGAVRGVEAVIHLVGIISEVGEKSFENIHVQGTKNMLRACQGAGVGRFIHMSALGTRPGAVSRYHRTKWEAEETVRGSGLVFTIFRPSLVYGPEDQFVNLFAKIIRRSPVVPVIGNGLAKSAPVGVECVAKGFVGALRQGAAEGKVFDLCGPDRMTFLEILDCILSVMRRRRMKVRIPVGVARVQAALLDRVYPAVLGKAPPLNRDQVTMLQEDNVGDGEPANRVFGLRHLPFSQGIHYLSRG